MHVNPSSSAMPNRSHGLQVLDNGHDAFGGAPAAHQVACDTWALMALPGKHVRDWGHVVQIAATAMAAAELTARTGDRDGQGASRIHKDYIACQFIALRTNLIPIVCACPAQERFSRESRHSPSLHPL